MAHPMLNDKRLERRRVQAKFAIHRDSIWSCDASLRSKPIGIGMASNLGAKWIDNEEPRKRRPVSR